MNQNLKNLLIVIVGGLVLVGVMFYWQNLRGVGPAINKPPQDIVDIIDDHNSQPGENSTTYPLKVPDNFKIEIFAKNLAGARVIEIAPGKMYVSQTSQGRVSALTVGNDGKVQSQTVEISGLRNPHGLAIDPQDPNVLFVAAENQIIRHEISSKKDTKIADLPTSGGGHYTRTIKFGPDGRMYVSIGSSCNVCRENDPRRAAIYTLNKDGSDFKSFAIGLRNTVFFTWSEVDGSMWGNDMGRDLLGDNIPPEEINILAEGKNYGWPICYGNNIHDDNFDKNVYIRNPCMEPFETPPHIEMQAHSAPLGLDFVPEEGWPEDMWYDLIVAFHGSWNRAEPTGYKLVRIKLDDKGNYQGMEDFISGWLSNAGALGRPVDVLIQPGGTMYVSDDKAGVIYKITYKRE